MLTEFAITKFISFLHTQGGGGCSVSFCAKYYPYISKCLTDFMTLHSLENPLLFHYFGHLYNYREMNESYLLLRVSSPFQTLLYYAAWVIAAQSSFFIVVGSYSCVFQITCTCDGCLSMQSHFVFWNLGRVHFFLAIRTDEVWKTFFPLVCLSGKYENPLRKVEIYSNE